jgi:hypothetical protein
MDDRGPSFQEILRKTHNEKFEDVSNKAQLHLMAEFLQDLYSPVDKVMLADIRTRNNWVQIEKEWFEACFGMANPWADRGQVGNTIRNSHVRKVSNIKEITLGGIEAAKAMLAQLTGEAFRSLPDTAAPAAPAAIVHDVPSTGSGGASSSSGLAPRGSVALSFAPVVSGGNAVGGASSSSDPAPKGGASASSAPPAIGGGVPLMALVAKWPTGGVITANAPSTADIRARGKGAPLAPPKAPQKAPLWRHLRLCLRKERVKEKEIGPTLLCPRTAGLRACGAKPLLRGIGVAARGGPLQQRRGTLGKARAPRSLSARLQTS